MLVNKWSKAVVLACSILLLPISLSAWAQTLSQAQKETFSAIYEPELGTIYACPSNTATVVGFCANTVKSAPNAPHILLPSSLPIGIIVLQHGLADSPYFVRSIGEGLQKKGYLVILPLTPGHGKKDATKDMRDDALQQRWYQHVNQIMAFAKTFDVPISIGGFSTGGSLSIYYALKHPKDVRSVMLFSGALALPGAAEALAKVWGIKSLAKFIDGKYESYGVHPYKYATIAGYSALVLLDVINDVRNMVEQTHLDEHRISMPIFAAHSLADRLTPFSGVEDLVAKVEGDHVVFKIDKKFDVCHADLPISELQLIGLKFDRSKVNQSERCAVPKANPLHAQMMAMLDKFLAIHMQPIR